MKKNIILIFLLLAFFAAALPAENCGMLVYAGDAAYEGGDLESPGPRHRLWILASGWRYERTD